MGLATSGSMIPYATRTSFHKTHVIVHRIQTNELFEGIRCPPTPVQSLSVDEVIPIIVLDGHFAVIRLSENATDCTPGWRPRTVQ